MNQKCSRVIRKLRKHILFVLKEEKINTKKIQLTKNINYSVDKGLASIEVWKKYKNPTSNFHGISIKSLLKTEPIVLKSRASRNNLCSYCQEGVLDFTADWVQCDICNKWIHQICISNQESFSGSFVCNICRKGNALSIVSESTNHTNIDTYNNGLVKDNTYYKETGKRYHIAFFKNYLCDVKEITSDDFKILSGNEWLSNFIVDIFFNMFNTKPDIYQIINCLTASRIFLYADGENHPSLLSVVFDKNI